MLIEKFSMKMIFMKKILIEILEAISPELNENNTDRMVN